MVLVITTACNRQCPFCFEGDLKSGPVRQMELADVDDLCDFFRIGERPPGYVVTLMGGEPTLHPDLPRMVDLIRSHNPTVKILVLTNLACREEVLAELTLRGVGLLVNLVPPEYNPPAVAEAIERNFDRLAQMGDFVYNLAVTITDPAQDFGFLYSHLERDTGRQVYSLRIGYSAPGKDFANLFVREHTRAVGDAYLAVVERCHRINPHLTFANECPLNLCLADPAVYARLRARVSFMSLTCQRPNLDILPDFSTHWCFAFHGVPEMRIENVFDYPAPEAVEAALRDRMVTLLRRLGAQCRHSECRHIECSGPCAAIDYYRATHGEK